MSPRMMGFPAPVGNS